MFSILIVDDHPHLVEHLMTTISWESYGITGVFGACSGPEAEEALQQRQIHLLLTDIRMPGMSGLELIERARALWPRIDCIILTGFADFEYAKRAIELKAVHYVLKPVRETELLPLIEGMVSERKRELEEQARIAQLEQASELAAMEERRRIAHDLHDLMGHTLTHTIIQLEAASRLLEADKAGGVERIKQTQQLVRQGLAEVRDAVSAIRKSDEHADLETEVTRYLKEVARLGVELTASVELPFPLTDPHYIKVILLALKEGMTNGLRHGQATRFELTLVSEQAEKQLRFALWNNGAAFAGEQSGFGLTGMRERVQGLGGTLKLSAPPDKGGALLELHIPL